MSFFEVHHTEPEPEPDREQPVWAGPPTGVLPGLSHQRAVLFKTERAFLVVQQFRCFPNGVEFALELLLRDEPDGHDLPWDVHYRGRKGALDDELLRLGVLFSDGTKWTNVDWRPHQGDPTPPHISPRGGGGGNKRFEMTYWMWPLPPGDVVTIVSEWPAYDIPETRVDIDAAELRERAGEAEVAWPD